MESHLFVQKTDAASLLSRSYFFENIGTAACTICLLPRRKT